MLCEMSLNSRYRFLSLLRVLLLLTISTHSCKAITLDNVAKSDWLEGSFRANLCSAASCDSCTTACPSASEIAKDDAYCRQVQPFLRKSSLNDAYISCTKNICEATQIKNACGLIKIDQRYSVTSQVDKEIKKTLARMRAVRIEKSKFDRANPLNPSVSLYYKQAISRIQKCKEMFRSALSARAHNVELKEYMKSLEYRRVNQEVTRFRFENEDLHRHLTFWEKQYRTLALAVRTSPEGLKDARDTLFSEMKAYEADATLISMLQNTTLTKEDRAELVIKLKQNVQDEIEQARTQQAHLLRERQFIKGARREIYIMLRDVLAKLRRGLIEVRCGGDMLSHIVDDALMSTKN